MRFAIIDNGIVTNIILADQEFVDQLGGTVVNVTDVECGIGDTWDGTKFSKVIEQIKSSVPDSVTRRQAIQQLIIEGLDDDVQAVIDAIPDTIQRKLMQAWYRDSQIFERNRPEILSMWAALGRTQEQLDDMFIAASKL